MQPSSKYASTEKTYAGGFVYKETDNIFSDIYTLDDPIDMSVSYTTPINSNFNKVNMGGWNSNSAAAYVNKRQRFRKEWTISGGGKAYSNVNGIAVSKSPFTSTGNVTVVFSNGVGSKYYFGKSAQGTATIGSFGRKLITDFEVNKVIFKYSVTGWTKAEFDSYKENGTLADSHNISITDFVDNPANYLVRTFEAVPVAYWDGSTWKSNSLSNSPNIHINFLIDTDKVSGICNIQKHHYDNASGTTSYGGYNFSVYNSTSGNTTEIASLIRGAVVSELQNVGSGMGGFVLDSVTDPLELEPDLSLDEMTNMCDTGVQGAGDTLPAHDVSWCSALTVLKYDQYTLSYDVGSSGQTHFSRYNMYICTGMKGEYVDKMFAYAGVYFYTGSLQDLIDSGATPTNLKVTGMRLGEMNSAGQTTGNWIEPNQMDDYVGPNKDGSIIHPDYNPTPPSPTPSDDDIDVNSFGGGSKLGGVDNLWLLTAQQLSDLHTAINNNNDPNFEPLNSIISVLGLAISPMYIFGDDISTVTNITIKKSDGTSWSSGVNGHICASQVSSFGLTGNISIKRKYNNFLDYPPYASHEIFLPLCGWIPLPSCCVGRQLSVYYVPDIQTGGVRGLVLCDGCIVGEKYGILGANIPFTSNGHGLMIGGIISGGVQTLADFATAMSGLATGNAIATMYGGSSFFSDGFNMALAANQNRTSVIGQNQDRTGFSDGTYIRIKSVYQDVKTDPLFGHTIGYLCHESGVLSDFHGFTVCENPHVHISATSAEKEEIKRLLEEGVILPSA